MAEVDNSHIIGDINARPTEYAEDEQLHKLKRYDAALGAAGHDQMHYRPASFYQVDLYIITDVAISSTGDSCRFTAPWPFTIWGADVGCESAAGATGTVDIYTDDGSTDASILDAPEDVKTGAGVGQRVAPEDGSEDVAYGTEVYIQGASGAGDVMVGAQAHLYCQRL